MNITPPLGCRLSGYYIERIADGVLDELELRCLALACGDHTVLLFSTDHVGIEEAVLEPIAAFISDPTGVPRTAIFFHETHIHTSTFLNPESPIEAEREYYCRFRYAARDAAKMAIQDLCEARMGAGKGTAPNVAFIRRYRMKDGSVQTNPGINNPDIVEPVGTVDESVNVLRFDREKDSIVLVNFANHPDTVGGCRYSADWPGFTRRILERALPGVKCIFLNGAQGDVNHVNVWPKGGDMNDLTMDFDDVARGYGHARHIGQVVVGGVLQAYDKVCYEDVENISFAMHRIRISAAVPDAGDLPEAHRIAALYAQRRENELPYTGMMLTTVVAEAERMVHLEKGPDFFEMSLSGLKIGNTSLIGIPGEPFSEIGKQIKAFEKDRMIIVSCCTNGYEGYFPMQEAYDEGGYEARASVFKPGVAELIISEGKKLLNELEEK